MILPSLLLARRWLTWHSFGPQLTAMISETRLFSFSRTACRRELHKLPATEMTVEAHLFQSNFIEGVHGVLDSLCHYTCLVWPYTYLEGGGKRVTCMAAI